MSEQHDNGLDRAFGGWALPAEYVQLRDSVRRFMVREVAPVEARQPHDANGIPADELRPLQAQARELGIWCPQTPVEYGGAGLNVLGQCVVAEETSQCRMGLYFPAGGAIGKDPPQIVFKGTPRQIEKYGLSAVRNGSRTFMAISEASGGSDPARSISTRAVRMGDRYVVNGAKMWISGVGMADWGVLFARTGEPGQRGGITAFIIDPKRAGLTLKEIGVMRSYAPYEVHFENYEIPVEDRLGEEGQGFGLAEEWLVHARIPYGAASIGVAQAALNIAMKWAKERKTFGHLLADRQAIQWMVVDSEVELRAARLLVYQAAWKADQGLDVKTDASIAKLYATEVASRVLDRSMQIMGGLGVSKELPIERWYREMRIRRIGEGPSEVQRMVIARTLLNQ